MADIEEGRDRYKFEGDVGPLLVHPGPNLVEVGRIWPDFPGPAKYGRRTMLVESGPSWHGIVETWAEFN